MAGFFDRLRGRGRDDPEQGEAAPSIAPPTPYWHQIPGEPAHAYQDFRAWLESTEDRSITAWANRTGRNVGTILGYSAAHRWIARRAAYRAHLDRIADANAEDERARIAREHVRALELLRDYGTAGIERLLGEGRFTPQTAIAALKTAIEGERLIAGQPTARVAFTAAEGLPDAVLDAIAALQAGDLAGAAEALQRAAAEGSESS